MFCWLLYAYRQIGLAYIFGNSKGDSNIQPLVLYMQNSLQIVAVDMNNILQVR